MSSTKVALSSLLQVQYKFLHLIIGITLCGGKEGGKDGEGAIPSLGDILLPEVNEENATAVVQLSYLEIYGCICEGGCKLHFFYIPSSPTIDVKVENWRVISKLGLSYRNYLCAVWEMRLKWLFLPDKPRAI